MGIYPVKPLLLTLELRECCQNLGAVTTWINTRPDLGDVSACACRRDHLLYRTKGICLFLLWKPASRSGHIMRTGVTIGYAGKYEGGAPFCRPNITKLQGIAAKPGEVLISPESVHRWKS
jgi:hypothetical protein